MNLARIGSRDFLKAVRPFVGLFVVLLLFACDAELRSLFFKGSNFKMILTQTVIVAIGAMGMTLVIVSGGIDLSAGSVVALCSVVTARLIEQGHGLAAVLMLTVLSRWAGWPCQRRHHHGGSDDAVHCDAWHDGHRARHLKVARQQSDRQSGVMLRGRSLSMSGFLHGVSQSIHGLRIAAYFFTVARRCLAGAWPRGGDDRGAALYRVWPVRFLHRLQRGHCAAVRHPRELQQSDDLRLGRRVLSVWLE